MKQLLYTYIIVAILWSFSCTNKRGQEDVEDKSEILTLSDHSRNKIRIANLANVIDIIPLESSSHCFLSEINKIIEFNNDFYILDKIQKKLLVFNKDGKYLRQIGKRGIGPGEYPNISDFIIDMDSQKIIILSTISSSNIYQYNMDGSFCSKKEISKSLLWNIISTPTGYICSTNNFTFTKGDEAYLLYIYDKSFELVNKKKKVLPLQIHTPVMLSTPFQILDGTVHYTDPFTNQIYSILGNSETFKSYKINLENPVPPEISANTNRFIKEQLEYDFMMDVYMTKEYILITYVCNKKYNVIILSKDKLKNEISGAFIGAFPKVYQGHDDTILSPITMQEYLGNWKYLYSDPNIESFQEDDNMVIVRWKIKDLNNKRP